MLKSIIFCTNNLQITEKTVPLHCVFHSIRFKVNKGWSKALLLFLYPFPSQPPLHLILMSDLFAHVEKNAVFCINYNKRKNNLK